MKRSQKRACLQSLNFLHCLPAVPQALFPVSPNRTELYWRELGVRREAQSAEASSAAAPLTSQARRRRRAGQEPGTGTASLNQARLSSVAAMTAARFEHAHAFPRTHARLRLSRCQRLPGSWCEALERSLPPRSAETVATGPGVPIPGIPRRKKY